LIKIKIILGSSNNLVGTWVSLLRRNEVNKTTDDKQKTNKVANQTLTAKPLINSIETK
jgi:hypothetical protein